MPLPVRLPRAEADLSSAAVDAFAGALGGRAALLDTLVIGSGDPAVDKVVDLLDDARYDGWPLRRICTLAGLTIADLFVAYKKALFAKMHLEATRVITQQIGGVLTDFLARAQPHDAPCAECCGSGTDTPKATARIPTPTPIPCTTCHGTGVVHVLPDVERQKVALELAQLLQTRAGISIQQNTLQLPPDRPARGGVGSIDALQAAIQAVLYPRPTPGLPPAPIVEGTVVADPPEAP